MQSANEGVGWAIFVPAVLLLILICGCHSTKPLTIPNGCYLNTENSDYINVRDKTISIHMENIPCHLPGAPAIDCRYGLTEDGRVWLNMPGQSVEAAFGVGHFYYVWNGSDIEVTDPKTGKTAKFSPKAPGHDPAHPN